jgi:hypothetical protein
MDQQAAAIVTVDWTSHDMTTLAYIQFNIGASIGFYIIIPSVLENTGNRFAALFVKVWN